MPQADHASGFVVNRVRTLRRSSLITMQNLVVVSNTGCAHVGVSKIYGMPGLIPLGRARLTQETRPIPCVIMPPPPQGGGIMSDVCLSVTYMGPISRTERPIGTEVVHVTRTPLSTFKVKRSRSPGRFRWLYWQANMDIQ